MSIHNVSENISLMQKSVLNMEPSVMLQSNLGNNSQYGVLALSTDWQFS